MSNEPKILKIDVNVKVLSKGIHQGQVRKPKLSMTPHDNERNTINNDLIKDIIVKGTVNSLV